jgi:uncharacterized protein YdeI (YjbR/CyaY-like superfamily)
MKELEYIHFGNREEFRDWLQKNHELSPGIWVVFFKKNVNQNSLKYPELLEEVLCFGWIDSLIKKIDDNKYARKITPRTNIRKWSEVNKKIVSTLIINGKMTPAGLNKIESYSDKGKVDWENKTCEKKVIEKIDVPDFIVSQLSQNEPALMNFNNLAPTYKRHYILWITTAKRNETVQSRLKESIELLKENRKLGLK